MSGFPGPGDPETWGPITSPMDPRYVPCPCEDEGEECEGACEVEPDYEPDEPEPDEYREWAGVEEPW